MNLLPLTETEMNEIANYVRDEDFNPQGLFQIVAQEDKTYLLRWWSEPQLPSEFIEAFSIDRNWGRLVIGDGDMFSWQGQREFVAGYQPV